MEENDGNNETVEKTPKNRRVKRETTSYYVVQHMYHDFSSAAEDVEDSSALAQGSFSGSSKTVGTTLFPSKLHAALDLIEAEGLASIVSWQPHGRCFRVHKPKEFERMLLYKHFGISKISSFRRQLNLYGFSRLTVGKDKGGYYHELFLRGKLFLAHRINRVGVKGTGVRARSNPNEEPDFWQMPFVRGHDVDATDGNNDKKPPSFPSSTITTTSITKQKLTEQEQQMVGKLHEASSAVSVASAATDQTGNSLKNTFSVIPPASRQMIESVFRTRESSLRAAAPCASIPDSSIFDVINKKLDDKVISGTAQDAGSSGKSTISSSYNTGRSIEGRGGWPVQLHQYQPNAEGRILVIQQRHSTSIEKRQHSSRGIKESGDEESKKDDDEDDAEFMKEIDSVI